MPVQASLFDTAPHQASGPRVTTTAEMFRDACALVAPMVAAGLTDAQIDSARCVGEAAAAGVTTPTTSTSVYRGCVHCIRDAGHTYARFPLADIRAHLETIERTQERMF